MNLPEGMPDRCPCGELLGSSASALERRAAMYRKGRRTFRCQRCNIRLRMPIDRRAACRRGGLASAASRRLAKESGPTPQK